MTEILFIEHAPTAGAELRLEHGATIGREDCDVTLDDSDVSRRHAVLLVQGSGIAVEDLGSTNGTFVNDSRIEVVTELRNGDRVRFGDVVWELRMPNQATRAVQTVRPGADRTRAAPIQRQDPGLTVAQATLSPEAGTPRPAADPARNESRGDVPKPDFGATKAAPVDPASGRKPTAGATPASGGKPESGGTTAFSPSGGRFKRSAARRLEATIISYGVVIATVVAVAAYFAQR